jgi:glucose-6-phosphate isomerase
MADKSERNRKMTTPVKSVSSRVAWKALEAHHWKMRELDLRKLFAEDPKRGDRFTIEAADIYLDYSS